jgi:hypothetical protein
VAATGEITIAGNLQVVDSLLYILKFIARQGWLIEINRDFWHFIYFQ